MALRAGAQTVPRSGDVAIARISTDPSFSWRPEGVSVTSSTVGLERITLRPKTLAAIIPITIELLEDAPNSAQVIQGALQAALGAELDRVLLAGTGASGEILGVIASD